MHRPGARTQCHSSGNLSEMGHYELKAASSRFFSPSPSPSCRETREDEARIPRERSGAERDEARLSRESETG